MTGANYEFKIDADSGYRSVMMGRCSDTQYAQVCAVLHGKEKPWVGLTSDEISEINQHCLKADEPIYSAVRIAEAKLRERNK